jgi:Helix-turn-helix domain
MIDPSSRPGFILLVNDDGSPFAWLKRGAPKAPSAEAVKLLKWRLANGLSQKTAGKLLGFTASRISAYERGRNPVPERAAARLDALGLESGRRTVERAKAADKRAKAAARKRRFAGPSAAEAAK